MMTNLKSQKYLAVVKIIVNCNVCKLSPIFRCSRCIKILFNIQSYKNTHYHTCVSK